MSSAIDSSGKSFGPTRRIRTAERRDSGQAVEVTGRHPPLARRRVVGAVAYVLERERRAAVISVAFVGRRRMGLLNAEWKGRDGPTDVLAFALPEPDGRVTGDIYICRAVAAEEARARGIPVRRELVRLIIHGTLHVLGWEHPEGAGRTRSPMWRRQERYLACLT